LLARARQGHRNRETGVIEVNSRAISPTPEGQRRYSPAICTGAHKHRVEGNPNPKHISTSFVERQNFEYSHGQQAHDAIDECLLKEN
jgi:hypothetical protein